jgi:hypothetical protein
MKCPECGCNVQEISKSKEDGKWYYYCWYCARVRECPKDEKPVATCD